MDDVSRVKGFENAKLENSNLNECLLNCVVIYIWKRLILSAGISPTTCLGT